MTVMFTMIQRVAIYTQNVVLKRKRTFATNVEALAKAGNIRTNVQLPTNAQ